MNTILLTIATVISSVFGIHTPVQVPQQEYVTPAELVRALNNAENKKPVILGAAPSPSALATYTLAGSGVSSSATSITLTSFTIKQTGVKLQTSNLVQGASDNFYITLEPGNTTRQEIVGCTTVTQNANGSATLSGCTRGLSPIYPYTASTTLRFTHAGSSQVIFGDAPQIFNDIITYVDSAIVSGAVDSSLTAKGIVEKASAAEAAAHTAVGGGGTTAPLALTTDIASSSRVANTPVVVVSSSTDGYIDNSFISTSTLFNNPSFTGTTTMTTSTTYFTNGIRLIEIGRNIKTFTNTGTSTFTVPSGVTRVFAQVVGAGGGGGQSGSAGTCEGAGGGGAGGYSQEFIDVTGTTSIQVHVGSGGNQNVSGSASWSTFGTNGFYLSATGGSGVNGDLNSGGGGGVGSGGDLNLSGGGGGAGGTASVGGMGGVSFFGGGGGGTACTATGAAGAAYGSGGSGGNSNSGSGNQDGGAGAQGIVIVTW